MGGNRGTVTQKCLPPLGGGGEDSVTDGVTYFQKSMFEVLPLNVLVGKGSELGMFSIL